MEQRSLATDSGRFLLRLASVVWANRHHRRWPSGVRFTPSHVTVNIGGDTPESVGPLSLQASDDELMVELVLHAALRSEGLWQLPDLATATTAPLDQWALLLEELGKHEPALSYGHSSGQELGVAYESIEHSGHVVTILLHDAQGGRYRWRQALRAEPPFALPYEIAGWVRSGAPLTLLPDGSERRRVRTSGSD